MVATHQSNGDGVPARRFERIGDGRRRGLWTRQQHRALKVLGGVGQRAPVPQRRHVHEGRRRLAPVEVGQVDGRLGEPSVGEAVDFAPCHSPTSSVGPRFALDHAGHELTVQPIRQYVTCSSPHHDAHGIPVHHCRRSVRRSCRQRRRLGPAGTRRGAHGGNQGRHIRGRPLSL